MSALFVDFVGQPVRKGQPLFSLYSPDLLATQKELLLAAKTRECKELVDQLQRLAAEYSNYQKRMERHFQEEKKHGIQALVLDLLPAIDNFERALDAAASKPSS